MQNVKDFVSQNNLMTVEVSPGVSYSLRDVINTSYRLYNAKFEGSDTEESGFRRIFYRMIWVIFRTIIMSSDVDLKDMNMHSLNGKGIRGLALLKMATRSHLLRTFFGKYIDKVMAEIVWFGTSLTKRVDGKVETVDLRNYTTIANIKDPQERSHLEAVYYTYDQVLSHKEDWKDNWTEIEQLWEKMQKEGRSKFKILEYWCWGNIDKESEKDTDIHKICIKYLDRGDDKPANYKNVEQYDPQLELERFKTPFKRERTSKRMADKLGDEEEMFPYEQAGFFDAPGRWLDFGCAELLEGIQEHYNEYTNDKRKKDILDLKGIFVHKYTSTSNSLTQEFISNLDTGSVLSMDVNEDLQRLIIDTKSVEYINNVDKLYELMRLVMGVTAQGTGEELPASTSASGIKANFATQQTTYDFVRERMHHFLTALFQNGYFEDIIDEIDEQEMVAIIGDPKELAELDRDFIENVVRQNSVKRYKEMEKLKGDVTWAEVQQLEDLEQAEIDDAMVRFAQNGDTRWAEIKKSIMKSVPHTVEFYVNSEGFDKQSKIENYQKMLADPTFTGSRKAVEDAIYDLMGENPRQFDKTEEEKKAEAEQVRQEMMAQSGVMTAANPVANAMPA